MQAACAQAGVAGKATAYLPLAVVRGDGPAILDGFERLDLVALDDLDAIAGDDAWEFGLFTLFNGLIEHGGRLAMRGPAGARIGRNSPAGPRLAAFRFGGASPGASRGT